MVTRNIELKQFKLYKVVLDAFKEGFESNWGDAVTNIKKNLLPEVEGEVFHLFVLL